MSQSFEQVLSGARALNPQEQLTLISILSQLLAGSSSTIASSEDSDFLPQDAEIELLNRIQAVEEGKIKTIPGDTFRENLRKKYGL